MRYPIRFTIPFTQSQPLKFFGRGTVHFEETALVFEGHQALFYFFGLTWIGQKFLCDATTRTVPYSQVVRHRRPNYVTSFSHHVHFKQPDGLVAAFGFKMLGRRRQRSFDLTLRLEEYMISATGVAPVRS
jgi:hypothetical protein